MENQKDFTYLKSGDEVFVKVYTFNGYILRKLKVDKVTAGGKIKIGNATYYENGRNVSAGYNSSYLVHIDIESKEEYQRQNALAFLSKVDFSKFSTKELTDLYFTIKELQKGLPNEKE